MNPGGGRKPPGRDIALFNLIAQCRMPGGDPEARGRLRRALLDRGLSALEADGLIRMIIGEDARGCPE